MASNLLYLTSFDRKITNDEGRGVGPWVDSENPVLTASPFDKKSAFIAENGLRRVVDGAFPQLASVLNEMHGLDRSERYWSILLNLSVYWLVSAIYERLEIVRSAIDECGRDVRFRTLQPNGFRPPTTLQRIVRLFSESDLMNWQLFSQCVQSEELLHENYQYEFGDQESGIEIQNLEKRGLRRWVDHVNRGLRTRIAYHGLRVSSRRAKLRFLIGTRGHAWQIRSFPIDIEASSFSQEIDREKRALLEKVDWDIQDEVLSQLLTVCLKYNLPAVFVEEFSRLRGAVERLIKRNGIPDVILTGPVVGQPAFRMWMSECFHNGSSLHMVQHGSGYGDVPEDTREAHERSIADRYLTWGWKRRAKDKPLPAPRFAKDTQNQQPTVRDGVLWVTPGRMTYGPHKYPLWLRWHQLGWTGFGSNHCHRIACFRALDERIRSNTTIRFKGNDPDTEAAVQETFGTQNTDSRGGLVDRACRAQLVVIDHFPSTSLYELLHANIPVVLIDDIPDWYLDGAATDVLWDLVECGVIHRSAESAAELINDIYPNVHAWWNQTERQCTVTRARYRLARSADSPMTEYAAFINQHLD